LKNSSAIGFRFRVARDPKADLPKTIIRTLEWDEKWKSNPNKA
jgi:hypothetical protein